MASEQIAQRLRSTLGNLFAKTYRARLKMAPLDNRAVNV